MSNFPMRDLAKQIEGMFPNVVMGPVTLDQLTSILTEAYNKGVVDATTVPDDEIAAALREENGRLREALGHYAKQDMWQDHVIDSYSGQCWFFDWPGDLGENPWDIARAALTPQGASMNGDEK